MPTAYKCPVCNRYMDFDPEENEWYCLHCRENSDGWWTE